MSKSHHRFTPKSLLTYNHVQFLAAQYVRLGQELFAARKAHDEAVAEEQDHRIRLAQAANGIDPLTGREIGSPSRDS